MGCMGIVIFLFVYKSDSSQRSFFLSLSRARFLSGFLKKEENSAEVNSWEVRMFKLNSHILFRLVK